MRRNELLPGITSTDCPPTVVFDSRRAIERARRRADIRDAAQLFILAAVDWLVLRWPSAHVPGLGRHGSMMVVVAVNALFVLHVVLSRWLPRWSASRVAATWSAHEQSRFFTPPRL